MEMDNWTKDKKQDFLHHYQNTHFNENNLNSFVKCQFKRQSMFHLLQASQQVTSNEASCHLLKIKLKDYSGVVDKQGGVNNYASSVIDLIPHSSNDAQKWTSTAKANDLLKDFLRPLPGQCHNLSTEGYCLAQKPTKVDLERLLSTKNTFLTFSTAEKAIPSAPVPHTQSNINTPNVQAYQIVKSTSGPKRLGEASYNAHPESTLMNAIGSRVFGTNRAAINQSNRQDTGVPKNSPSFRTAGTELKLQNLKKYGKQPQSSGGGREESLTYGNNKKSLGGRTRSVNSKFVPPIKSNSQEDLNGEANSYEEEIEDERLRLTDPKMVELIRSEIMDHGPPVEWNDIAGLDYAKATIQEIVVLPMLRPDIFTGLRRPPKGILLFGPPGTGKTLIGKCIASQSKSTFFNISASSLTSKWVGEGEKMVRTLFTLARVYQPAVVFIDEIDSLLSQRSDTEHESSRRIKTEFLVQLDGAGTGEDDRILVIGATNRPQELDEAARRRLVKRLYIPLPDYEARSQIVRNLMATERNILTQQHIEEIASLTEGHSGADMKTLCQEACLGPIRSISFTEMQHIAPNQVRAVTVGDFQTAISRVRPSVSNKDIEVYINWDKTYGSGGAPK